MPRHPTLALAASLTALFVTACADSLPETVRTERLSIPASLLGCREQPEPPPDDADDRAVATWIGDLADAGEDCRQRLARVAELVNP